MISAWFIKAGVESEHWLNCPQMFDAVVKLAGFNVFVSSFQAAEATCGKMENNQILCAAVLLRHSFLGGGGVLTMACNHEHPKVLYFFIQDTIETLVLELCSKGGSVHHVRFRFLLCVKNSVWTLNGFFSLSFCNCKCSHNLLWLIWFYFRLLPFTSPPLRKPLTCGFDTVSMLTEWPAGGPTTADETTKTTCWKRQHLKNVFVFFLHGKNSSLPWVAIQSWVGVALVLESLDVRNSDWSNVVTPTWTKRVCVMV